MFLFNKMGRNFENIDIVKKYRVTIKKEIVSMTGWLVEQEKE